MMQRIERKYSEVPREGMLKGGVGSLLAGRRCRDGWGGVNRAEAAAPTRASLQDWLSQGRNRSSSGPARGFPPLRAAIDHAASSSHRGATTPVPDPCQNDDRQECADGHSGDVHARLDLGLP